MKILGRQILLENKLFLRSFEDIFWTLAFPTFFMVLYGLIYRDTVWEDFNMRAIDYTMPGIIILALMVTGIMATVTGFVEDRQKGIYRRLSLTPVKRQAIIGSQIIYRYIIMLVQTIIITVIATLAFNVKINGSYLLLWAIITVGALCFLSLGFLMTTFIKNARTATPISMIVFFGLMFLGGLFFPNTIMPDFLNKISLVLPSTHLNNALRMVVMEGSGIRAMWKELLITGAWIVGCLGLSIKFFKWE
ncbi:MAG: ABC transporter permease [Actinomycetia bacterium]|nr:ABC transporter permease [Actinomycetes bacterium]